MGRAERGFACCVTLGFVKFNLKELDMNYELCFYLVLAFIAGRCSKLKIYIGPEHEKYNNAENLPPESNEN